MQAKAKSQRGVMGEAGLLRKEMTSLGRRESFWVGLQCSQMAQHICICLGRLPGAEHQKCYHFLQRKRPRHKESSPLNQIKDSISLIPLLTYFLKLFSFFPQSLKNIGHCFFFFFKKAFFWLNQEERKSLVSEHKEAVEILESMRQERKQRRGFLKRPDFCSCSSFSVAPSPHFFN